MPRLYVNCACAARKHVTEALMQFWRTGILACFIAMTCIPSTASAATSSSIPNTWADGISLQEFIAFIAENNSALQVARNGNTIAREVITEERGIFQPILSITSRANRSLQPLSVDDQVLQRNIDPYPTSNQTLESSLSQLLATGGTIQGTTRLTREKTGGIEDYQFRGYVGVTFDQPLLQGFGKDVTGADIRLAELGSEIAEQTLVSTQNSVVADAVIVYFDALRTQLFLENLEARLAVLEELRDQSGALIQSGRISASTQLEIDTAIRQVEALRLNARQELARFKANMLIFAGSRLSGISDFELDTNALPSSQLVACELVECIETAMANRADLQAQHIRIEQASITELKATDRQRIEMDLNVELGFSEQSSQVRDAFDISELEGQPDARIALQIRAPLGRNRDAAVRRARMERMNAELELQNLKVTIENEIVAQRMAVRQTADTWAQWQKMVDTYSEQLAIAKSSLQEGRGDIMTVLRAREARLNAQASLDEARVAHAHAWIRLQASQGQADQLQSVNVLDQ